MSMKHDRSVPVLQPYETVRDGFVFNWFPQNGRGFKRELDFIIDHYYDVLECNRGDEKYWNKVREEATAFDDGTMHQPFQYIVEMKLQSDVRHVVGFCLLRRGKLCSYLEESKTFLCDYPENTWYIEFICTQKGRGYGKALMEEIHRHGIELNIEFITMSALPEVILFYHKLGYQLTLDLRCSEDDAISRIAQNVRDEIDKLKSNNEPIPANVDEMLTKEPFVSLILESLNRHLSMVQIRGDQCATPRECSVDGIYMIICLRDKKIEVAPHVPEVFVDSMERLKRMRKVQYLEDDRDYMDFLGH